MRLKKSADEVLKDIQSVTMTTTYSSLNSSLKLEMGPVTFAIQCAISDAITAGFRVLIQNQYTDDDFERDLNLK